MELVSNLLGFLVHPCCLSQISNLDFSNIDLSKPSGRALRTDLKWTSVLLLKLIVPIIVTIVRGLVQHGAVPTVHTSWFGCDGVLMQTGIFLQPGQHIQWCFGYHTWRRECCHVVFHSSGTTRRMGQLCPCARDASVRSPSADDCMTVRCVLNCKQSGVYGIMNNLMALGYSSSRDEAALYYNATEALVADVAHAELSLLLGTNKFASVYAQPAAEVAVATASACVIQTSPDFGSPMPSSQIAAYLADCQDFMHGVLLGGEFAALQFFLDYSRVLALQLMKAQDQPPAVR